MRRVLPRAAARRLRCAACRLMTGVPALFMSACVYFSQAGELPYSEALPADAETRLGVHLDAPDYPERARVINDPDAALKARVDMIEAADRSIDLQYFIWENDASGILLIDRLLAAADRGVRVRALMDDVRLEGLSKRLRALSRHPNIDIRIYNPFSLRLDWPVRLLRLIEFAIDGRRLNHRMHNKLLVADNQLALLGGRNIGDEYFGRGLARNFVDMDLLLSGRIVPQLSTGFDRYWNSGWAVPVEQLPTLSPLPDRLSALHQRIITRLSAHPDLLALRNTDGSAGLVADLRRGHRLERALSIVDEPSLRWGDAPDQLAEQLTGVAMSAAREIMIVSPYLVLTPKLLTIAQALNDKGVRIAVLTNSLASNDVVIAQAAYARFRKRILESGVELYEYRHDVAARPAADSSYASLHPKFLVFDDHTTFIGSLNLDPRSFRINTELGVVLQSATLAHELRLYFETLTTPQNAWRVERGERGLKWVSARGELDDEPARDRWQRAKFAILRWLPLDNQM